MNDYISMGGTANLFTITEKSGIGVLTGTIDGAAYGEPTSDSAMATEFTMMHYFLDKNGSRLIRTIRPSCIPVRREKAARWRVRYTVVEATGRFAGAGGTFRSRSWVKAIGGGNRPSRHNVGVVRFEGRICRK